MRIWAIALLAALLTVPLASAHNEYETDDGKYRVVVGQLNEPTVTWSKTGLDLCFQQLPPGEMDEEAEGAPLTVNTGSLTVTLTAPNNKTLSQPLRGQFGRPGCYQFQDPYVLTVPGQYKVDMTGSINGTPVAFHGMLAGGAVKDQVALTFPDGGAPTNLDLSSESAALKNRVDTLEASNKELSQRVKALETKASATPSKGASALPVVGLVLAVLAVALIRRRT